jgi:hypothetical protein
MLQVWHVYERDEFGNPLRKDVLATEETYTAAQLKRRANGMRLAVFHGMPIDLELWEQLADGTWVYVNTLTTEVQFTMSETIDYDD